MKRNLFFITFASFLCFFSHAQVNSRIDSVFLAKIQYDSTMAKHDLKNGTVRLLNIFSPTWGSTGMRFNEMIEPYQLDAIDNSFGFKNEFIAIDSILPQHAKLENLNIMAW